MGQDFSIDDGFNLLKLQVKEAEEDGALRYIASTYDRSYTEFYAMDFREGFVLMGHDGPGHIAISDAKPVLRGLGLYHGKRGHGVSVEFKVRNGPVTILGLTQTAEGRFKMLAAEGESIDHPTDTR